LLKLGGSGLFVSSFLCFRWWCRLIYVTKSRLHAVPWNTPKIYLSCFCVHCCTDRHTSASLQRQTNRDTNTPSLDETYRTEIDPSPPLPPTFFVRERVLGWENHVPTLVIISLCSTPMSPAPTTKCFSARTPQLIANKTNLLCVRVNGHACLSTNNSTTYGRQTCITQPQPCMHSHPPRGEK